MEKESHSIVYDAIREFKKLRRQYRVAERAGNQFEPVAYNRMLELDEWLADNNPDWHQNYPELERKEIPT